MNAKWTGAILALSLIAATSCARAAKATLEGKVLTRHGNTITMMGFDTKLDGRLITADTAVYHTDTGVIDLKGHVELHFGKHVKTFPGEVHQD